MPAPTPAPEPQPDETEAEAATRAYITSAIEYYGENGPDATVEFYKSPAGIQNGLMLTLVDKSEGKLLIYPTLPSLEGQYVGPGSSFPGLAGLLRAASAEGYWTNFRSINPVTKQEEPRRILAVLHDGLVFFASHSILTEDVADSTQEYVEKAIARYEKDELEATIEHYNSLDSLDGQFYLFLIGADDNYLAHPIFPHLIGSDIKDVVGSDGQELGQEIAEATEEGIWVEYLWPHPVSRKEQQKVTWAVRHDGLIFASGYYAGGLEVEVPPWQDADPREYTVQYVNRAIERYEQDGLESMLNYYNSVASFEGEWYLFATDENDIYHVHPLLPGLIGKDIKDVVGSDGYELGKELAKATEEGVWVEYLWPHPVTLKEVPKVGYAVRRDGMLFASGYYVQVDDPPAHTQAYVQQAIEYYQANGLESTIAHYNSQDSVDGQWSLTLADKKDIVRVAILTPGLVGTDLKDLGAGAIRQIGKEFAAATERGRWVSHVFPNIRSSETLYAHNWVIRHDGLLFMSRYYDDSPEVPDTAKTDDALTLAYVQKAIGRYEREGLDATVAYYNSEESVEGERGLRIYDAATQTMLASGLFPVERGEKRLSIGSLSELVKFFEGATEEARWLDKVGHDRNFQDVPKRVVAILHDGLVFSASHVTLQENVAEATKHYVSRAIARYDEEGLDATVAHFNSQESLDGNFYLFLIGADDIYVAHPIFPHLIGTDIKDVVGSDGQELGKEIAQATEDGIWVEYLWPNPITRIEEYKTTWAIRHNGLIFASGYYTAGDEVLETPWKDADPREYTVDYVDRAIARYERDGPDAMKAYYNSVASFEGQWYLFAMDENDIYIVHSLLPRLIGTDIKDVVGSDGYELGKEIAKATEEGIWVEYLWPHPVTLRDAPKVGYAKRHDGMIFASGYYPEVSDPRAYTEDYVQTAIDYYEANGLDATVAYYNSQESVDGQWYLILADGSDGIGLVHPITSIAVGKDIRILKGFIAGEPVGELIFNAPEEGHWFEFLFALSNTSEILTKHMWSIRHAGLIFTSGYYAD